MKWTPTPPRHNSVQIAWLIIVLLLPGTLPTIAALSGFQSGGRPVEEFEYYFHPDPDSEGIGGDMTTTNTSIHVKMITGRIKPDEISIRVSPKRPASGTFPEAGTNWIPFREMVTVDLGEEDGERHLFISARWKNVKKGGGSGMIVIVQRSKPPIFITDPTQWLISRPLIQVKGFSSVPLGSINFDLINANVTLLDENGFVTDRDLETGRCEFQLYDVELSPGTNTIRLRCSDLAGNTTTTNLSYVFSTAGDTTPPAFIAILWPPPRAQVPIGEFTIRGRVDDYTAMFAGQCEAARQTNAISGIADRDGIFWYEKLPVHKGLNRYVLVATDVADNSSRTNLEVFGVDTPLLRMDPLPESELKKPLGSLLNVSGLIVPPTYDVVVNGVLAAVKPDGTWTASEVPTRGVGVLVFDLVATPNAASPDGPPPRSLDRLSAHARLGTNAFTLNASSPTCGVLQLHLSGVEGRSFVLLSSTNLTHWVPILTNLQSEATFHHEVNTGGSGCQFFRIEPLK